MIARAVCLALVLAIAAGCSTVEDVTRAEIVIRAGTNVVSVSQPKDTAIDRMEFNPATGTLTLEGYTSAANAGALRAQQAQIEAQTGIFREGFGIVREGIAAYSRFPIPAPMPAASPGPGPGGGAPATAPASNSVPVPVRP